MNETHPGLKDPTANQTFKTICPYCSIGCTLEIDLHNGLVSGVKGVSGLINPDGYSCIYGRKGFTFINDPQRITQPILKVKDEFKPISWPEAFDLLVEKLRQG